MLQIKDLTFTVENTDPGASGQKTILDRFNYTFEHGKFYGITGPNGSGKTSLAKVIMGINPVTSGRIVFEGNDITDLSITDRAKSGIAYSFQNPARFKGISFRQLLSIAAETDDESVLQKIVARVGICSLDFLEKSVDAKLSGGEIKKIELATTIARNPKLAIYDEPDTGIDLWTIGPMIDLLKKEQKNHQTTTIVVSHNKNFLEAADTILILKKGKFVYEGDLDGAIHLLTDLSTCTLPDLCEGENDVRCFR
ncbi:MAG: ATP-binding cassette domain-containing protein [Candidatus Magnetomorum sp.]|nr:ATP-binding cassette domain-containing protein [Candidatus Magnetomorum sp.]